MRPQYPTAEADLYSYYAYKPSVLHVKRRVRVAGCKVGRQTAVERSASLRDPPLS